MTLTPVNVARLWQGRVCQDTRCVYDSTISLHLPKRVCGRMYHSLHLERQSSCCSLWRHAREKPVCRLVLVLRLKCSLAGNMSVCLPLSSAFSETKANWIQPVALLGGSSTEQVTSLKFRKSTLLWDHLLHSFTRDAKSRTRDGACLSSDQKVQTLSELLFHKTH